MDTDTTALRFSTAGLPAAKRLAAWRDVVCDVYTGLDCDTDDDGFQADLTQSRLGVISCSQIASTAQTVRRTPARIARAREHHVLVSFAEQGRGCIRQDGKDLVIGPRQFALYDTSRPYELAFDGAFRQTIVKLPYNRVVACIGHTERLTAVAFSCDDPVERLAFDFIRQAVSLAQNIPAESGSALSNQFVDLLSLSWSRRLVADPKGTSSYRSAMLTRLKTFVKEHLVDPALSIEMAARTMGMSARSVGGLLQTDGTSFRRYVLSERLDRCRTRLADPKLMHVEISQIAYSCGFNDVAYFSRSFREHFDCSPREWRSRSRSDGLNTSEPL